MRILLKYTNATVNHVQPPYVGDIGNPLCLAQKHTENTSCILFARLSYALPLSTHGVTGADGGKKKYPFHIPQKKSFTL